MRTYKHYEHIQSRRSHSNCNECRADCERKFVNALSPFKYPSVVRYYIDYIKPRLIALKTDNTQEARIWHKEFILALHRRISSHVPVKGRKYCDGYLERLKGMRFKDSKANEAYLRNFAARGASALN